MRTSFRLHRWLVWVLDGRPVRLDGLGDLVDPEGAPAGGGEWVRLAQAEHGVFAGEDPSAWWQHTVEAAALYPLVRHG